MAFIEANNLGIDNLLEVSDQWRSLAFGILSCRGCEISFFDSVQQQDKYVFCRGFNMAFKKLGKLTIGPFLRSLSAIRVPIISPFETSNWILIIGQTLC